MRLTALSAALAGIAVLLPAQTVLADPGSSTAAVAAVAIRPAFLAQTAGERRREYLREAFLSPGAFFRVMGPAAGGQKGNEPPEWGQGAGAFGKRVAARFAEAQLQTALYHGSAAAAGYQTGYRRCGCEGGFRRLGYALSRPFITRNARGASVPNLPLLGSYYSANMISTYWYPDRYRPLKDGLQSGHVQVGISMGFNVIREFGPEFRKLFRFGR